MAVSQPIDVTTAFNNNAGVLNLDVSGWRYCVVQIVTPSSAITFNTTNDGGAVQSSTNDAPISATNWLACQGTNLTSGSAVTSVNATAIVRFEVVGTFLQLTSSAATAAKVLIRYFNSL